LPVYSVTDLAGLYLASTSPCQGEAIQAGVRT